jgi:hypothetical protein
MGLLGGAAGALAETLGHAISLGVLSVIMIVMIAYTYYTKKRRYGTYWQKNGPLILIIIAMPLVIWDSTSHVITDQLPNLNQFTLLEQAGDLPPTARPRNCCLLPEQGQQPSAQPPFDEPKNPPLSFLSKHHPVT